MLDVEIEIERRAKRLVGIRQQWVGLRRFQPCLAGDRECGPLGSRERDDLGGRGGDGGDHGSPSQPAMRSRATPKGELAVPRGSRSNALRMVESGTPCWRARLQTTAESLAAESLSEPTFVLFRKISAKSPFEYRLIVAEYPRRLHAKLNVMEARRLANLRRSAPLIMFAMLLLTAFAMETDPGAARTAAGVLLCDGDECAH